MKYLKSIALLLAFSVALGSCGNPKEGTVEDKGAVKGDTLNTREGTGEGPVGEGELGSGH